MVFALAGDSTITSGLGNEAPHGFKAEWMKAGWSKAGWIEGGDSAGQSASRHERAAESSGIGVRKCRHGGCRPVKRDRRDDHPRTPGDKVYSALVLAFLGLPDPKEIIESMSPFGEIAVILIVTVVGVVIAWPLLVITGIWVLYRIIRGWIALADARAMPG